MATRKGSAEVTGGIWITPAEATCQEEDHSESQPPLPEADVQQESQGNGQLLQIVRYSTRQLLPESKVQQEGPEDGQLLRWLWASVEVVDRLQARPARIYT